ncbi:MAG TPA: hypothetical protein VFW06_08970 [Acidimicrobiia bacterium]|nr:hypothetical protein [Acidimicrobiia bacterium]
MSSDDPIAPLVGAFTDAAAHRGFGEAWFEFAGRPVRLRTVGDELSAKMTEPFSHLHCEPTTEPRLTIDVWDERATGIALPTSASVSPGAAGLVEDRRHAGVVWRVGDGLARALDRESGRIIGWCRDAAILPSEERTKPLRHLLDTWYLDRHVPVIHAAAVAADGRGALVAGPSGIGKSTTALACAAAGLDLAGDDEVGLEETTAGAFRVHSLYSVARVEREHLRAHPWLACGESPVHQVGDKSLVFAGRAPAVRWARSMPVAAILVPARDGGPGLRPASGAAVLRALAPSTLIGPVGGGRWTLERLARLAAAAPAFFFCAPLEPSAVAALVREALARAVS